MLPSRRQLKRCCDFDIRSSTLRASTLYNVAVRRNRRCSFYCNQRAPPTRRSRAGCCATRRSSTRRPRTKTCDATASINAAPTRRIRPPTVTGISMRRFRRRSTSTTSTTHRSINSSSHPATATRLQRSSFACVVESNN